MPTSGEIVQQVKCPMEHASAVSSVCGRHDDLATGDEAGTICLWAVNEDANTTSEQVLKKTGGFESQGSPVSALCLWKNLLVAAYGSGHIRVYDIDTKFMKTEITAHAKWITGLDLAQEPGLVVSVSEDSFFRVWKLNDEDEQSTVSLVSGACVKDSCLCGAVFLDDSGTRLALAAADNCDISLYKSQSI